MATDDQTRNKLRATGLVAGLSVWVALSGIGSLSAPAGFFLAVLVYWMLTGILVWAVCKGDTGDREQPPVNESEGVPGWLLLVAVLALLVWIGLSGVGDMSGSAGFVFALLAMIGLTGLVIWARSGEDAEDVGDHRFAMLPEEEEEDEAPAAAQAAPEVAPEAEGQAAPEPAAETAPQPQPDAEAAPDLPPAAEAMADALAAEVPAVPVAAAGPAPLPEPGADGVAALADAASAPDDLKRIRGIGPALEKTLHEAGVVRVSQIAAWDQAQIDDMAARLGRMGGRIRSDDWVGQAQALLARSADASPSVEG